MADCVCVCVGACMRLHVGAVMKRNLNIPGYIQLRPTRSNQRCNLLHVSCVFGSDIYTSDTHACVNGTVSIPLYVHFDHN